MTRLVVDASTLLSATVAAPDTPLARLMRAVRGGLVEIAVCPQLLGEVRRGLERPYFRERLTREEPYEIPRALAAIGVAFADPHAPPRVVRDPNDDYLVELARACEALWAVISSCAARQLAAIGDQLAFIALAPRIGPEKAVATIRG